MDAPRTYSPLQRTLHWITALAVIAMIPIGLYMVRRGAATNFDSLTNTLYSWHKLIGFCILWLVVVRIIVRLMRGAPPPEPTLNPLQRFAAEATHFGIYVLLLVVPILGWLGVSYFGARGAALGITLPAIVSENQGLAKTILAYHGWAALALGALVLMHIGAALMHKVVLKDGVFARMWPDKRDTSQA